MENIRLNTQRIDLIKSGIAGFSFSLQNQDVKLLMHVIGAIVPAIPMRPYHTGYYAKSPDNDIWLVSHSYLLPCSIIFDFNQLFLSSNEITGQ